MAARVVLLESGAKIGAARAHVAGGDQPAPDGKEMRHERHGEAENRGDLGCVAVRAHVVGGDVLQNRPRVRGRLQRAARLRSSPTLRRRRRRHARSRLGSARGPGVRPLRSNPGFATSRPTGGLTSGRPYDQDARSARRPGARSRTTTRRSPDLGSGARRRDRSRRREQEARSPRPPRARDRGRRRQRHTTAPRRS